MKTASATLALFALLVAAPAAAQPQRVNPFTAGVRDTLGPGNRDALRGSTRRRAAPEFYRRGYDFYLRAGQPIVATLNADWDTYLLLQAPDGTVVSDDDGGPGLNSRLVYTATVTGTHRIFVTSYRRQTGGAYSFQITEGAHMVPNAHVGPRSAPGFVGIGGTVSGALTAADNAYLPGNQQRSGPDHWRQAFTFTMTQDHINRYGSGVTITAAFAGWDGYLYLVDPNGNVVTYDDDWNGITGSQMRFPCNDLGRYTIVVSSYSPGVGGAFTLSTTSGI